MIGKIGKADIMKLAHLSRMELSQSEADSFARDIDSILDYVGQITEAHGEDLEIKIPDHRNVLREDNDAHESGIYTEAILKQAPEQEKGYFKVKKILSND